MQLRLGFLVGLVNLVMLATIGSGCGQPEAGAEDTSSTDSVTAPHAVVIDHELAITDVSVAEDPTRTIEPCKVAPNATLGAWTFGHLMTELAAKEKLDPQTMVLGWLKTWETDEHVNGFTVAARPAILQTVIQPWLARSGNTGKLDLAKAPFRLTEIVNRIDLRQVSSLGVPIDSGEGRFVFNFIDMRSGGCVATPFNVIFEYKLIGSSMTDVLFWAHLFHNLGALPFGAGYNQALQSITDRFTSPRVVAHGDGGTTTIPFTLGQIRTNEIELAFPWELREFNLTPTGLVNVTVKQTPDVSFNGTDALATLINQNTPAILAGTFNVPAKLLGASSPNNPTLWNATGMVKIANPSARHLFALNTCSGCHNLETGNPSFVQVGTREPGHAAPLSGFLTGITTTDPVTGTKLTFSDLKRRADVLTKLLTTGAGPVSAFVE